MWVKRLDQKKKSKGFAFIPDATLSKQGRSLLDLKDGTEVKGKRVGISLARNRYSIHGQHLQDMDKRASKDLVVFSVLERLKNLGVEQIEEIYLPDNPNKEGKSKGYALLEFKDPFRCNVKTVYLEGLAESWEEDKLKKLCEQYGEDEKVQLSQKFLSTRRKDFGFVSFVTRESAELLKQILQNLDKGRIGKKAAKGGYKVRWMVKRQELRHQR
ncbi:hypothetical protein Syun_022929 [Stephania yunnanensis]|uniref:RRM domain-containing protein n=1 Tax=Stephania yunnanensis TaxID=152371 RepID=A0AAP0HZ17_9MAGN